MRAEYLVTEPQDGHLVIIGHFQTPIKQHAGQYAEKKLREIRKTHKRAQLWLRSLEIERGIG